MAGGGGAAGSRPNPIWRPPGLSGVAAAPPLVRRPRFTGLAAATDDVSDSSATGVEALLRLAGLERRPRLLGSGAKNLSSELLIGGKSVGGIGPAVGAPAKTEPPANEKAAGNLSSIRDELEKLITRPRRRLGDEEEFRLGKHAFRQ